MQKLTMAGLDPAIQLLLTVETEEAPISRGMASTKWRLLTW
jgi:hypothetical protein